MREPVLKNGHVCLWLLICLGISGNTLRVNSFHQKRLIEISVNFNNFRNNCGCKNETFVTETANQTENQQRGTLMINNWWSPETINESRRNNLQISARRIIINRLSEWNRTGIWITKSFAITIEIIIRMDDFRQLLCCTKSMYVEETLKCWGNVSPQTKVESVKGRARVETCCVWQGPDKMGRNKPALRCGRCRKAMKA